MATRYEIDGYGIVELNHVSWPETGRVFAQLPLDTEVDFKDVPVVENGSWLVYDMGKGVVRKYAADTDSIGLLYMGEKEYNRFEVGLKNYALKTEGDYPPRLGMPMVGDIYTTNNFAVDAAITDVEKALADLETTPLYLVPQAGEASPVLVNDLGTATTAAQVVKYYTLPNGEPGIKVQFIKVA